MVRVQVLIGYLVAGGVSDGVFFGHICLFSRYGRFFVRFLSRFSSRHPSVLVLRANRGDGEPRAHASKVERCNSLKDRSDGLFARSLRCVVWRQYNILVFLLVEWRINSEIVYLLVIDRGLFEKFEIISMVFGIAAGI